MNRGAQAIVAAVLTSACATQARPDDAVVRALHDTYSFKPHELDRKQQEARGKGLDALWDAATKDPKRYLPAIRAELAGDRQLPFFYFDAGRLLVKLSNEPADRALALAALARVDLSDIEPIDYVTAVNGFARDGLDSSVAAFKILAEPDFVAYVPAHALELHQGMALQFMLLPSGHPAIAAAVVARFAVEKTESAKKALLLLAFDLAPDGDALLRRVAGDASETPAVRTDARTLVKQMSDVAAVRTTVQLMALITGRAPPPASAPEVLPPGFPKTVPEVLAARRKAAARISDEALDEMELDTMLLRMYLARDPGPSH